jgi:pantoate--beta-alanine ligase
VQAVYIPTVEDMYGQAVNHQNHKDLFQTKVSVSGIPDQLCGAARAGHFDGVATIVTKLLMRTRPDKAFFGEKDFQQLAVIRQFVRDLDYDIDIVGVPIVRDHNGLALSSRNRYLTADQYQIAIQMNKILTIAADQLQANKNVDVVCQDAQDALLGAGFEKVDYVAVRRADHLTSVQQKEGQELRILAAAWLGKARLIDNRAA